MSVSTSGFDAFLSEFLSRETTSAQVAEEVAQCSISQVIEEYEAATNKTPRNTVAASYLPSSNTFKVRPASHMEAPRMAA